MKEYTIFIDGSHLDKQHNGRLGIGGVLLDDNYTKVNEFSIELTPEYMKEKFDVDKCSNPTAELTALYHAILGFGEKLKKADKVIIYADYIGVREWMTGKWKIKEVYISKVKDEIDKEVNRLGLKGKIEYRWVKGHQTGNSLEASWNNYVDLLAKGEKK